MSTAILYRMAAGIAGAISRAAGQATIEAQVMDASTPVTVYGVPVKLVSGKVQPVASGDDATVVYGLLVRPYPTQSTSNTAQGLGQGAPSTVQPADVMRRGYMSVKCNAGTPAKRSQAYVRVANAATGKPIGGIEAAADSGKCVAIAGCFFTGPADADGLTEVEFNL